MERRALLFKDKRGQNGLTGILFLVASIAAFAIFLLIVGYIGRTISTELRDGINSTNEEVNNAFNKTIQVSSSGLNALWYIMFGGLLLGLMISAWFIPTHPIFVAPFVILLIIAIVVGAVMSNAYDELVVVPQLAQSAGEQGAIGFLMSKLPYVALIIGLITLIVTFAKPGSGGGPAPPM